MKNGRFIPLAAAVILAAAVEGLAQSWILDSTYPVRVGTNSSIVMWPSQAAFIASNDIVQASALPALSGAFIASNSIATTSATNTFTALPVLPVLPGRILVGNAASQTAAVAVSGDVTLATNGTVAIAARAITGAMLPQTLPAYIFVGNATSNAAAVALSGGATITTNGALSTVGLSTNVVVLILGTGGSNTLTFTNGRLTAIQ